jgi:hypothetical protein
MHRVVEKLLTPHIVIKESRQLPAQTTLKVHKNDNFFGFDFEFCTISVLVRHK